MLVTLLIMFLRVCVYFILFIVMYPHGKLNGDSSIRMSNGGRTVTPLVDDWAFFSKTFKRGTLINVSEDPLI